MHHWTTRTYATALLLFGSWGCDVAERVRGGDEAADTAAPASGAGEVSVALQAPGALRAGEEGTIRVSLTNRGDSVPRGLRLDLIVPSWMEPTAPRPGDRAVTVVPTDEGTRFSYALDDPGLQPGRVETVEQRVRVPVGSPVARGMTAWSPVVRARLVGPSGESVSEVQSEIALAGMAGGDSTGAAEPRDRLGAVRLGMRTAAVRSAVAGSRDTSWTTEGVRERGLVVPAERGSRAIALLAGDSVVRIEVRESGPRTREGLGVGSTLGELRAAYGRPCVASGEDEVVVWFAGAPGVSFALEAPPGGGGGAAGVDAERLPPSTRVTRWWLRRAVDDCR